MLAIGVIQFVGQVRIDIDIKRLAHAIGKMVQLQVDDGFARGTVGQQPALGNQQSSAQPVHRLRPPADRHRLLVGAADLDAYAASGLPTTTMGRSLAEDPLFFAAPLAAGTLLAP